MNQKGIELNDRDFKILKIIYMFRFCLGRHIKELADFNNMSVCDRRLKKLIESKYIERKRYIWGIPYIYTLSHKGRLLIGANKRAETIKLDQVNHDITVIDCVIHILKRYCVSLDDLITEKELHSKSGFTTRQHAPDFVLNKDGEKMAFEIELTPKSESTLRKNVQMNYLNFDNQIWITDNSKVKRNLQALKNEFNLEIVNLEDIKNGY